MPQEQVHATPAVRTYPRPSSQEMEQLASDDAAAQEHITVDEIDDLLDEIDSVLEENALEVVRCFVQRGGQ